MKSRIGLAIALAFLTSVAVATTTFPCQGNLSGPSDEGYRSNGRHRFPWFASLGVYAPVSIGSGNSYVWGGDLAVGYVVPSDPIDLRLCLRGQVFNASDQNQNTVSTNIGQAEADALFRVDRFYFGPGLSLGTMSGNYVGTPAIVASEPEVPGASATVYAFTFGADVSNRTFVEARYQTSGAVAYRGISVSVGFRFQL